MSSSFLWLHFYLPSSTITVCLRCRKTSWECLWMTISMPIIWEISIMFLIISEPKHLDLKFFKELPFMLQGIRKDFPKFLAPAHLLVFFNKLNIWGSKKRHPMYMMYGRVQLFHSRSAVNSISSIIGAKGRLLTSQSRSEWTTTGVLGSVHWWVTGTCTQGNRT